ncbi:nicotinate-nucleotide adenylyltransferase [Aurantimicrobium minutum]|uniref:nicotinate-nucleotide adenylyltransferase n=1 Tax=Aurantimicrobium minutum TaxID=708131 RepID=UPI002475D47D|nr:nicotinate-nucleotide adenylyltransferase [Aurantimicrobium minutum]
MTGPHRRIGILGGTFDPPQNGHIAVALEVIRRLELELVLFVPAGSPWQKTEAISAQHRVAMSRLAIAGHNSLALSTVDVDRDGPTFTVDTLRDLRREYPDADLFFILGDEAFEGIETWKSFEELANLATFVVVSRTGTPVKVPAKLSPSVNLLEITTLPISSTLCRERIQEGKALEGLVPSAVADYIFDHQLYRRPQ